MATGITKRHSRTCRTREGGRCNCNAGWEAWVYLPREGKKIRKTFAREAEAKSWRSDALVAANKGCATGGIADHAPRGMGGLVQGRQGWHRPQPLGRSLQAIRPARLRGGDEAPGPPRSGCCPTR
jgi:hypothetical protein